jgi:hypothetical protein
MPAHVQVKRLREITGIIPKRVEGTRSFHWFQPRPRKPQGVRGRFSCLSAAPCSSRFDVVNVCAHGAEAQDSRQAANAAIGV